MGGRLLKRWLSLPLKDIQPVNDRLDVVQFFVVNGAVKDEIAGLIRQVGDLERLISKVALNRINPREVVQLKRALKAIDPIRDLCNKSECLPLIQIGEQLNPCKPFRKR
jgi:DNA mismatch repair protein MutS